MVKSVTGRRICRIVRNFEKTFVFPFLGRALGHKFELVVAPYSLVPSLRLRGKHR